MRLYLVIDQYRLIIYVGSGSELTIESIDGNTQTDLSMDPEHVDLLLNSCFDCIQGHYHEKFSEINLIYDPASEIGKSLIEALRKMNLSFSENNLTDSMCEFLKAVRGHRFDSVLTSQQVLSASVVGINFDFFNYRFNDDGKFITSPFSLIADTLCAEEGDNREAILPLDLFVRFCTKKEKNKLS